MDGCVENKTAFTKNVVNKIEKEMLKYLCHYVAPYWQLDSKDLSYIMSNSLWCPWTIDLTVRDLTDLLHFSWDQKENIN